MEESWMTYLERLKYPPEWATEAQDKHEAQNKHGEPWIAMEAKNDIGRPEWSTMAENTLDWAREPRMSMEESWMTEN